MIILDEASLAVTMLEEVAPAATMTMLEKTASAATMTMLAEAAPWRP